MLAISRGIQTETFESSSSPAAKHHVRGNSSQTGTGGDRSPAAASDETSRGDTGLPSPCRADEPLEQTLPLIAYEFAYKKRLSPPLCRPSQSCSPIPHLRGSRLAARQGSWRDTSYSSPDSLGHQYIARGRNTSPCGGGSAAEVDGTVWTTGGDGVSPNLRVRGHVRVVQHVQCVYQEAQPTRCPAARPQGVEEGVERGARRSRRRFGGGLGLTTSCVASEHSLEVDADRITIPRGSTRRPFSFHA